MSWFISIVLGLLFTIVGGFGVGLIAGLFVVNWYRISSFEGRAAYFVVFVALLGGVVGMITGTVCARIVAASAEPTFLAGAWLTTKSLAVMFAIATLFTWLGAPPALVKKAEVEPAAPVELDSGPDEQTQFEALAPTAPVAAWLQYTRYGSPPVRMARALEVLRARADLVPELAPLLHSTERTTQNDALCVLESLPEHAEAFANDVRAVGTELADAITRFNVSAPADDPRFEVPADLYVRFSAWLVAARALRARDAGTFTAELRAIAQVARVRSDSRTMQQDILPTAEHYVVEWTAADELQIKRDH